MTNDQGRQTHLRLAILIGAVPALPLLALGMSQEYWGRIYLLWGAAYAILNSRSLVALFRGAGGESGGGPTTFRILSREGISWCLSALVLAVINLTPLCLGQDNGDGRNNLAMCVLLTGVWFGAMSVLVIPLATMVAVFARRTMRSRR
ncbi:MAG: hypothetical protein MUE60_09675 [Candidatus Eisenbacteria bacterium]|nr:hypothetical protein [Candidatus Eisenbacteria bacterium]